jgi:hypothetical protein
VYADQICALDIFVDFDMPEAVIGDLSAELELSPYGPNEQLIQVWESSQLSPAFTHPLHTLYTPSRRSPLALCARARVQLSLLCSRPPHVYTPCTNTHTVLFLA